MLRHILRDRVLAEYCDARHGGGERGPDRAAMPSELRVITGIGGFRIDAFEPVLPNAMREYLTAIPGPAFTNTENNGGMFVLRARDVRAWLEEYGGDERRDELRW